MTKAKLNELLNLALNVRENAWIECEHSDKLRAREKLTKAEQDLKLVRQMIKSKMQEVVL